MEAEVNEVLPLVTVSQTSETITQTINPLNLVVGDKGKIKNTFLLFYSEFSTS